MMVIGLVSGKEFVVDDAAYTVFNEATGDRRQVFTTKDRIITVKDEHIEYWNEIRTPEYIEKIQDMIGIQKSDPNIHGVDVV